MTSLSPSYRGYRFPPEIISHLKRVVTDPSFDKHMRTEATSDYVRRMRQWSTPRTH